MLLFVDDMIIVRHDPKKISGLKKALSKSFVMKDLGSVKKIFGMKITRDRSKKLLWLSQESYFEKLLERLRAARCTKHPAYAGSEEGPHPEGWIVGGLIAMLDMQIEQLNVKTIFLHGDLEEEIYMEQPKGF